MGITGLIPFLEKASCKTNVRKLQNSTVAIDSYCWLHKGAFAVADKLARGQETDVHIQYCLKYVNMLLDNNIKPILVFDGRHLPAKAETEAKRREQRKNAKQRAAELLRLGKTEEARTYLRRCVDITHDMALKLIKACRDMNVDCIVAPYEADGQLAYLNLQSIADYVITEDSDLVLFGCKKILFKLDLTGNCLCIESSKLHLSMGCREDKFTFDKFRNMCILSGCDYLDSLPGIGLAKACKFMTKTEEVDMMRALDKIPAYLNMRQLVVTEEYKINFMKANATFQHMVVYDPRTRRNVHLTDPIEAGTDMEYCTNAGVKLDDETALMLAVGNLNPFTMKAMDNWHPDRREKPKGVRTNGWKQSRIAKHTSIWDATIDLNFYRKRTAVGEQQTLINMVKRIHDPSKNKPSVNIEDEDNDESINSDDLLSAYGCKPFEPPAKKFKDLDIQAQPTSSTATSSNIPESPKRNPFKIKSNASPHLMELLSPTKITKENSSFIRNQSPVKRIEYPNPSPVKRMDYRKLEKLSRFQRTIIPKDQNVISRFFTNPPVKPETSTKTERMDALKTEEAEQSTAIEKTEPEDDQDQMRALGNVKVKPVSATLSPNYLYLEMSSAINRSNSNGLERERTPDRDDISLSGGSTGTTANSQQLFDDDYDDIHAKSNDAGSDNSLCSVVEIIPERQLIVIDDDDEVEETNARQSASRKDTNELISPSMVSRNLYSKRSCRRPGLSKKKPPAKETNGPIQSRLSMFGFQKKPQAS